MRRFNQLLRIRTSAFSASATALALAATVALAMGSGSTALAATTVHPQRTALYQLQDAFTAIVDEVSPSVVSITSKPKAKPQSEDQVPDMFKGLPFGMPDDPSNPGTQPTSYGTGVVVRSDGYILTNDHVVGGADKVKVIFKDGQEYEGTVLKDPSSDIDLIKIDAKNLPAAKLGDSSAVKVGAWAIAIGSPFELDQTVTLGVISAKGRHEAVEDKFYPNLIQTDASINPGNSGGPLVNIAGEVIGINTLIRSQSGGNIGIGFAIPINTAKFVINQLINNGKVNRGFLGIVPADLSPKDADHYGVKNGAFVQEVDESSPAEHAGMQVEDVIVEFGGRSISNQIELREAIAATVPGKEVPIVVVRNRNKITLHVKVSEHKSIEAVSPESKETINKKLGFAIADLTPDLAKDLKLDAATKGVVVTKIAQPGVALIAGLRPGELIIKANDKPVATVAEFLDAVKDLQPGDTLRLIVKTTDRVSIVKMSIE